MKTTIDLPYDVLHRAEVYAAENQTTLKELVAEGLRRVTTPPADYSAHRDRSARLIAALQDLGIEGPVNPLKREEIYDRQVFR